MRLVLLAKLAAERGYFVAFGTFNKAPFRSTGSAPRDYFKSACKFDLRPPPFLDEPQADCYEDPTPPTLFCLWYFLMVYQSSGVKSFCNALMILQREIFDLPSRFRYLIIYLYPEHANMFDNS